MIRRIPYFPLGKVKVSIVIIFISLLLIAFSLFRLFLNEPISAPAGQIVRWSSQDAYEYMILPNGTKMSKIVFKDTQVKIGRNVIDNLTTFYLFGNPLYDPQGSGIYNQALYNKNDGVYTIRVQKVKGKKAIFFYSDKPQSNRMANLQLFDNDLLTSPAVEGFIIEENVHRILEFVHYVTQGNTLQEFEKDSPEFKRQVELIDISQM